MSLGKMLPWAKCLWAFVKLSIRDDALCNYNDIYLEAVGEDDVPGTQRIPPAEDPVVSMEVRTESEDENDIGLEGFADALENFEFRT